MKTSKMKIKRINEKKNMTRIKLDQEGHHKKVLQSSSVEEDDLERKI